MASLDRIILFVAALVILSLFVYPPFMGIDPNSDGRMHASLGHHPAWSPPSSEFAFRNLYPSAPELPDVERLSGFSPRVNRVRLTFYALAVALAHGIFVFVRRRTKASGELPT